MLDAFQDKVINKYSPIPLYYQLKEILRDYIREQPADAPLPSEPDLCTHFGISRPTVRQAMAELAQEGYLYRSKGRGSFVARNKIDRNFVNWQDGFNEEIRGRGLVPDTRVLEFRRTIPDETVATKLGIQPDSDVYFLRRVRSVEAEPVVVVNSYLPADRLAGFESKDLSSRSLHSILEQDYGLHLQRTRRVLEAIGAPQTEAELLNIRAGNPVQYFENIVILAEGSAIEYSEGWYRGDRTRFTFEYEKHRNPVL